MWMLAEATGSYLHDFVSLDWTEYNMWGASGNALFIRKGIREKHS